MVDAAYRKALTASAADTSEHLHTLGIYCQRSHPEFALAVLTTAINSKTLPARLARVSTYTAGRILARQGRIDEEMVSVSVCAPVCVRARACVCTHMYVRTVVRARVCVWVPGCVGALVRVRVCVRLRVRVRAWVRSRVCVCIYILSTIGNMDSATHHPPPLFCKNEKRRRRRRRRKKKR